MGTVLCWPTTSVQGPALGVIGVILSEISSIANIFSVGMVLFKNIMLEV